MWQKLYPKVSYEQHLARLLLFDEEHRSNKVVNNRRWTTSSKTMYVQMGEKVEEIYVLLWNNYDVLLWNNYGVLLWNNYDVLLWTNYGVSHPTNPLHHKVWSYVTPNVLTETKCHTKLQLRLYFFICCLSCLTHLKAGNVSNLGSSKEIQPQTFSTKKGVQSSEIDLRFTVYDRMSVPRIIWEISL